MSVLKSRRRESRTAYVQYAYNIYTEVLLFLTKLSTRYSRLLAPKTIELASELLDHCEKANTIFQNNELGKNLRKTHVIEARASLMALDVHLSICYETMMLNPQGCFTKSGGASIPSSEAIKRLDRLAENLGNQIDQENKLLNGLLKAI